MTSTKPLVELAASAFATVVSVSGTASVGDTTLVGGTALVVVATAAEATDADVTSGPSTQTATPRTATPRSATSRTSRPVAVDAKRGNAGRRNTIGVARFLGTVGEQRYWSLRGSSAQAGPHTE